MRLILSISDPAGSTVLVEPSKTLGRGTLTIGRSVDNDWVLPDPELYLSKKHCRIDFVGDGYSVTDTSANGVFVNGAATPLGRGNTAKLNDGDRLAIGGYELSIRVDSQAISEPVPTGAPGTADPFALDDDLSEASQFGIAEGEPTESPFAQPEPPGTGATIPEDFNPFGGEDPGLPPAGESGRRPRGGDAEPFSGFGPIGEDARERAEDRLASQPDHVPSEQEFFRPPGVVEGSIPEDWDAEDAGEPEPPAPPPRRSEPPPAPPPARMSEPPVAPPSVAPPAVAGGAALEAFVAGAGVDGARLAGHDGAELMRGLGEIFRAMVVGLREVLVARAAIKNELRLKRTIIASAGNNPLKFSASDEEAVAALMQPPRPGYLAPAEAVSEGFDDIKAHEVATMAGMQAALNALLSQFDPEKLKEQLDQQAKHKTSLLGGRKAQYWELYEAQYKEIARDAAERFNGRYAAEFVNAYEDQIRKL